MRSVRSVKPFVLTLFLSNKYTYAKIQRQADGHIVAAASTIEKQLRSELPSTSNKQVNGTVVSRECFDA
jgi:ribosomal protein L18